MLSFTYPPYQTSWPAPSQLIRLSSHVTSPGNLSRSLQAGLEASTSSQFLCRYFIGLFLPPCWQLLWSETVSFPCWILSAKHIIGTLFIYWESSSAVLVGETIAWPRASVSTTAVYSHPQPLHCPQRPHYWPRNQLDSCFVESNCLLTYHVLSPL